MSDVIIELPAAGWAPRAYQMAAWDAMEAGTRKISLWWHRRSGKDEISLHRTAVEMARRVGNYWHLLPESEQARTAMWNAINPRTGRRRIDEVFPVEFRTRTQNQEMLIELRNGSTWQLKGSDNYESLVGAPPVGIVFSEWSKASPSALAYLSPIIAENDGWMWFITTPEGKNHAYRTHRSFEADPNAFAQTLTVDDTCVFTPERLAEEHATLCDVYGHAVGEALFRQEYYCSAESAIIGSVFGHEIAQLRALGRVRALPVADTPVYTAWDLGRADATAIWWFQLVGNEVRVLEYEEDTLKDLGYYVSRIGGRRIENELADWAYGHDSIRYGDDIDGLTHRLSYNYGGHFLPHDAAHKTLSNSGRSCEMILRKALGGQVHVMQETQAGLDEGSRTAVIAFLRRCWFDTRADAGLETLSAYKYSYDEHRRTLSQSPVHNWASHCADAFRTAALAHAHIVGQAHRSTMFDIRSPMSRPLQPDLRYVV